METLITPSLNEIDCPSHGIVITANQRLARRLRESWDQRQRNHGRVTWSSPIILPLTAWLQQLASQHLPYQLLTPSQFQQLWRDVITTQQDSTLLLNPKQTATLAMSAWTTLHQWCLSFDVLANDPSHEAQLFYRWCQQISERCQAHAWLSACEIPNRLVTHTDARTLTNKTTIQWLGFDEFPPAIEQLISHLAHVHHVIIQIEYPAKSHHTLACHDIEHEIFSMAHWAKQQRHQNPHATIGCIIPTIHTHRDRLVDIFTQVHQPDAMRPGVTESQAAFNLSAGLPLIRYPIIRCALDWLAWLHQPQSYTRITSLLQSPYVHHIADDRDLGAKIDIQLREWGLIHGFHALFKALESIDKSDQHDDSQTPPFIQRCQAAYRLACDAPSTAPLNKWVAHIVSLLDCLGWPGSRTLNSEEYQLYTTWHQLLDQCTTLDVVLNQPLSWQEAWQACVDLARQMIFQPEGSHAPIQILGTLEAAGLTFDAMWVMSLDDKTWPPAPSPNPLLPYALQQAHNMPHATAQRELRYAQQVMHRLTHSATHVVFSYACFDGDREQSPSQLISDYPSLPNASTPGQTNTDLIALEPIPDAPYPVQPNEAIKGGAWILKQQALCPFKAFANIRLNAMSPATPLLGITPTQRGQITHDILDRIWHHLTSQHALNALSTLRRQALITQTIADVLKEAIRPNNALDSLLVNTESKRQHKLIDEWLTLESERSPFIVSAIETTHRITISGLTLNLRLDRVDELTDGSQVIIDYKTGSPSINDWMGDRPSDPQLPCYLQLFPTVSGLAFGQVRPETCAFVGITANDVIAKQIPGTQSIERVTKGERDWDQQRTSWEDTLNQLGTDFMQGQHEADPKHPQTTCRYCDYQPLCRIHHDAH